MPFGMCWHWWDSTLASADGCTCPDGSLLDGQCADRIGSRSSSGRHPTAAQRWRGRRRSQRRATKTPLPHIKIQLDHAWREDMIGKEVVGGDQQPAKRESASTTDGAGAAEPSSVGEVDAQAAAPRAMTIKAVGQATGPTSRQARAPPAQAAPKTRSAALQPHAFSRWPQPSQSSGQRGSRGGPCVAPRSKAATRPKPMPAPVRNPERSEFQMSPRAIGAPSRDVEIFLRSLAKLLDHPAEEPLIQMTPRTSAIGHSVVEEL